MNSSISISAVILTTLIGLNTASCWAQAKACVNVTLAPYNAVGNGTTDNTASIGAAIAAIPATGGCLYFPVLALLQVA